MSRTTARPGTTSEDQADLREANRRISLLDQENEVLRRARPISPRRTCGNYEAARPGAGRRDEIRHGDASGSQGGSSPGLLMAIQPVAGVERAEAVPHERAVGRPPRGP